MSKEERLKVLIVDDEKTNINDLSRILWSEYDVLAAKDGETALAVAQTSKPDIILLDVIMPGMSGFDVIVRLKNSDLTRDIPVIFITGLDSNQDEEKGLSLGAVDYITKPFHDSIVKQRVKTQLKLVRQISDAKVREVKERLERIINTAPLSYMLTIDGKVVELNENMRRDTGLSVGVDAEIIHASPEHRKALYEKVAREKTVINEIMKIKLTNGEVHRSIVNVTTVEYEHQTAAAVWAVDIEQDERYKDELIALQRETKEVKERLEWVIQTSSVGYLLVIGGKIVEINENLKDSLGMKEGDILRKSYAGMKLLGGISERLKRHEEVRNEVLEVDFVNGERHRCLVSVATFKYHDQPATVAWVVDIEQSERQKDQLQAARQNLQTILDMLPVAVRVLDRETNAITYANNAAAKMFGVTPADAYRMPYHNFIPETQMDGGNTDEMINNVTLTAEPVDTEITLRRPKDGMFDALVTSCLIDYNGRMSSLAIIQDLTEERKYQRMLANTAEKEREANSLKSRFLVNMSHEIRTPMNAIIGLTEIELHSDFPGEPKEIYKKINISAQNLLSIINDILDISKIEADKIELFEDEFELEEVINSALLVTVPRLDKKNVEFMFNGALDLPRYLVGDRTRLWQILKNFLDNSAKFTNNGKITLTVFAGQEHSGKESPPHLRSAESGEMVTLTFIIEDTGVGMSGEQLERAFLPYQQIYSDAQRRYSGTGLGMSISTQLCEIMGGTVKVESELGKGTTVHMNIPFKRSSKSEAEPWLAKVSGLSGISVLAVDDDRLSLDIMERLLNGNQVNCTTAQSGLEALEIITRHRDRGEAFDVILLDYMMDGLNGLETAKQIQLALPNAPKLLMVTAYQELLVKNDLKENGIHGVIEKPFIPSYFISKLCAVLGIEAGINEEPTDEYARFQDVNVLLCEDYRMNQDVAVGMLAQFGISTVVAENGSEGIALLNSGQKFDLILMDLQMPVMNGYEATRAIRSDTGFDAIPIIALTADAMKEIVDDCLEIGMDDHLAKPIEYGGLYKMLLKWIPESKRTSSGEVFRPKVDPLNEALTRFGGDEEWYRAALLEFSQMLPDEWQDYSGAMEDKDKAKRFVHKLKGAAGTLSEKELYQCAAQFEASLCGSKPEEGLYHQLIEISNTVKKRIIDQEAGANAVPLEEGTAEELVKLLTDLDVTLRECDPDAFDPVMKLLKSKAWPSVNEQKLNQLYDFVRKFDFGSALEVLSGIMGALPTNTFWT